MTLPVEVRRAAPDEVEATRELTNRSWLGVYPALIGHDVTEEIIRTRHASDLFAQQRAENPEGFLVALRDGVIVGHCHHFPTDSGTYVDRLHVEPSLKRGGVGREMMEFVFAHETGAERIWLTVLQGNDGALAFYQRIGMTIVGEKASNTGLAGIPAIELEWRNDGGKHIAE